MNAPTWITFTVSAVSVVVCCCCCCWIPARLPTTQNIWNRRQYSNIVRVVKSRRMRWVGHVARMGEDRVVYRVLVGKPERKKLLRRPRRRWEDNIKMDLQEVGGVVGTGWSWLKIGTGGGHLWVRWWTFGFHKCGEFLESRQSLLVSFSRRTLLHGVSK